MTKRERTSCPDDPRSMREQKLRLFALSQMRMGGRPGEGILEQELDGTLDGVEFTCECRG